MGLVKPETVNAIAALALKVPDNNVMVSTIPLSDALPVAPDGALNATTGAGEVARARPAPTSVITTLPPAGTVVAGVHVTDMVTLVAAALASLRAMVGLAVPRLLAGSEIAG